MADIDLRLIPEFDGNALTSVTEWLDKLELVCHLRGIGELHEVIPLRLTGGAFAVYQQMPEEVKDQKIKAALRADVAADPFMAYRGDNCNLSLYYDDFNVVDPLTDAA